MRDSPRTVRDAVIRLRAVIAVLDEAISMSGRVHEDPRAFTLRADLDVPKLLLNFERELSSLSLESQLARDAVAEETKQIAEWRHRRSVSEGEGSTFLATQALTRQREHELRTSELRLELEEWEQLIADYSSVIEMLRRPLPG